MDIDRTKAAEQQSTDLRARTPAETERPAKAADTIAPVIRPEHGGALGASRGENPPRQHEDAEAAARERRRSALAEIARAAHLRVGWFYKCTRCTRWHFNLAGGYAITADGAVATCHHVVEPGDTMKEGYLIAVTVDGEVLPVGEVLAANKLTDACIVRVRSEQPLKPLALNAEIEPGDEVWCYSDPAGREG